jgi:hypothetical protein
MPDLKNGSVVRIRARSLRFEPLYLWILLLSHYLEPQLRSLLPNRNLTPQSRSGRLNQRASYLRTNGNGYKTLIEPWRLYG